ncbi:MAG: hypothetical protein ACD_40C00081G0001, partial [uncultured bacterium]
GITDKEVLVVEREEIPAVLVAGGIRSGI